MKTVFYSIVFFCMLFFSNAVNAQWGGYPVWQQPAQQNPSQNQDPSQKQNQNQNQRSDRTANQDRYNENPRGPRDKNDDVWRNISDRIKADRVVFFTNRIELTPAEAQLFWPIYNEFDAKKDELYGQRTAIAMRYMYNAATLTEDELEGMLNQYWSIYQKEYKLSTDYHKKFLSVLSPAKVMKLYMTEEQFKNSYLQRMRGGR